MGQYEYFNINIFNSIPYHPYIGLGDTDIIFYIYTIDCHQYAMSENSCYQICCLFLIFTHNPVPVLNNEIRNPVQHAGTCFRC